MAGEYAAWLPAQCFRKQVTHEVTHEYINGKHEAFAVPEKGGVGFALDRSR